MTLVWLAVGVIAIVAGLYYVFMSPQSQLFGYFPYRVRPADKVVALTFDDGPNEPYTSELLAVLKRHQVKATFFVVGTSAQAHPQIVKRLVADGHVVGNHSYHHQFRNYALSFGFKSEIEQNQAILEGLIDRTPKLYRSPWLFRQPELLATVKRLQMVPVSGLFGSPWEIYQPSAASMVKATLRRVKPGVILIFHDGYNGKAAARGQTVEAIDRLIPELKRRGYRCVTAAELLGVEPYQTAKPDRNQLDAAAANQLN